VFSNLAIDHLARPRNRGPLPSFTHEGGVGSKGDGPFVHIWLQVEDGRIRAASYDTHGCPSSAAAAGVLTTLITGRTPEQALSLTDQELLTVLGGLPEGKEMFATMAIDALHKALEERTC
jgi:NifU-like protein involved in Fe-S cluster formation